MPKVDVHIPREAPPGVVQKRLIDISKALNANIEFGSPQNGPINIRGHWVTMTTPGANIEFTITHNLGFIPTGILIFAVDKAAHIYASRKNQWTATQAFFKADQATVSLQGLIC